MKLVFIIENDKHIGGGSYSIFKFAEYLAKNQNDVIVFAKNKIKAFDNQGIPKNLKLKYRGAIKRYFKGIGFINRLYCKSYTNLIIKPYLNKNKDIDFIIGLLREEAIKSTELGKKFNIKTANFVFESPPWMEKDLGESWYKEFKGKFKKSWLKTKQAYLSSDVLICNSKLSQKECESWINKKVDGYAYPGLDLELADEIKIDKKENQIIYIGRLNLYKNIDEILYAVSKIDNPPKLIIIGNGEEKNNLIKLVKELKINVEFLGNVDDYEKYVQIKKSLFMIFPSSHEGFGMPPMEALYCEIPCICSNKIIFKEVYRNKVEYFEEHDVKDLQKKIEFLLNRPDYRRKRGLRGREYILNNYSWKKSVKKIEKILKK